MEERPAGGPLQPPAVTPHRGFIFEPPFSLSGPSERLGQKPAGQGFGDLQHHLLQPTFPIWLKSFLSNSSMVFQPLSNYGPFLRVTSYNNSMICHFAVRYRSQEIERRLYGSVVKQAERAVGTPVEVYFVTRAAA